MCDTQLDRSRTPWMFSSIEGPHLLERPWTNYPPTCESCWPIAERRCPHLRGHQPSVRCYVIDCTPFGIQGDLYTSDARPAGTGPLAVRHGSPRIPAMLAKQALVSVPRIQPA